eukprot:UN4274
MCATSRIKVSNSRWSNTFLCNSTRLSSMRWRNTANNPQNLRWLPCELLRQQSGAVSSEALALLSRKLQIAGPQLERSSGVERRHGGRLARRTGRRAVIGNGALARLSDSQGP